MSDNNLVQGDLYVGKDVFINGESLNEELENIKVDAQTVFAQRMFA